MRKFLTMTMICVGLLLGSTSSYANHDTKVKTMETYKYMQLFQNIFEIIRAEHVNKVDDKKILEAAIRGMIGTLDKHSSYMTVKEFREMQQTMNNSFVGLGIQIEKDKDTGFIKVVSPIDGSPAQAAGMKTNDLITEVDGIKLKSLKLQEAIKYLRGPKKSTAVLSVIRDNKSIIVNVTRNIVVTKVVRTRMLPSNIGYIRLAQFSNNAVAEMAKGIRTLKKQFLKGLIIDLRNNPGGLLNGAISISDMFVKEGVIVSTRGRDAAHHTRTTRARSATIIPMSVPMVVLVNGGSASASEIVTGTLQDLKRATVVGVQSYGKGSVQSIMTMPTGSGLRLTRAKYYTASGKTIDNVGITPDVIIALPKDYEPKSKDEIDPQLQKAIEVILSGNARTGIE